MKTAAASGPSPARRQAPGAKALLWLVIVLGLGCATSRPIRVPSYKTQPAAKPRHLLVGAASVDITPMPGFPMGGHSIAGRFARGHWMRLRARAFYFRDTEGSSLALVSCDLFAIPAGLQQMVAAALHPKVPDATHREVADISRDNLIVTATHTHQGPGNFMSNAFYNGYSSPYPGFSRDLFDQMVGKIAEAVAKAVTDAEIHPEGAELLVTTTRARTLARNRAIRAFAMNDRASVQNPILANGPPPPLNVDCRSPALEYSDVCLRYAAVDPEVTVVAAIRPVGAVAAVLVFGAVHPTVLSHEVSFYSPDLVGFAMRELERGAVAWPRARGMVAGFFNGAEGDVSPRWNRRDVEEVRALGGELAMEIRNAIAAGSGDREADEVRISTARRAMDQYAFCHTWPTPGVGTLGGGEDGRFVSFDMGWRAPYRRAPEKKPGLFKRLMRWIRAPHQGVKQPGFEFKGTPILDATQLLAAPGNFPTEVPATVARLGSLAFVAVPVEMTTAMGRQVRQQLAPLLKAGKTVILGLANEYLEYVTTSAEYDVQDYEGGSTLFGPCTGDCYIKLLSQAAAQLGKDARTARSGRQQEIPGVEFRPGGPPMFGARFGIEYWGSNAEYTDQELKSPFATADRLGPDLWPRFEWREEESEDERVVLWTMGPAGWEIEEDDDGADPALATFLANGTKSERVWDAYWFPVSGSAESATHIFEVTVRGGRSTCSEPFTLADIRSGGRRLPLLPSSAKCPP